MAIHFLKTLLHLIGFYLSPYFPPFSVPVDSNFPIKSVNLGGWLVFEGDFKPNLFEGIPNKDLLDGTLLQIKSVKTRRYLHALEGWEDAIVANKWVPSNHETFRLWRVNETTFQIRTSRKWFWTLDGVNVVAHSKKAGLSEMFQIERSPDDLNRIRIKAPNGRFIQVKSEWKHGVTADYEGESDWSDDNPSVFDANINVSIHGEYQLTNGYGLEKASEIMKEHWETFITEEDFKFVAENGLNAVRIPVGWWIAQDPTPKPFVKGSLEYLDKAFTWSNKYGLKVILNLHGARYSQNGYDHTGTIDGVAEWGTSEENIKETVDVIDFLAARYYNDPSLLAISLLNEPLAPYVTYKSLRKYYTSAYNAVRTYSSKIYVIMEGRIGHIDQREIYPLASSLEGTVIDVHLYNLFESKYTSSAVQGNINIVYAGQASKLAIVTKKKGPMTFVGEWCGEWEVKNATKEEYQHFIKAQLEVYGHATFGWSFWSLKHRLDHWSLEWMIKNDYMKL